MKESSFWTRRIRRLLVLAAGCADKDIHVERIENAVAVGTPDVDYCIGGRCGKIELKYRPHHPSRAGTPVLGTGRGMRKSQIVWAVRRIRADGAVFLCIGTCVMTWFIDLRILDARGMLALETYSVEKLSSICVWHTGMPYDELAWSLCA